MTSTASLKRTAFGEIETIEIGLYTFSSPAGEVAITNYGGIIQSVRVPDRAGKLENVALGFGSLAEYLKHNHGPYFGAITGRFANRIRAGKFSLDGVEYQLPVNSFGSCLHGGVRGFDKYVWHAEQLEIDAGSALKLTRTSRHGEEGFPGALAASVTYSFAADGKLRIDYEATTDRPTVVNLTNHTYVNLAGEGSGTVEAQELTVAASRFNPMTPDYVPTSELAPVAGTPFDFRTPHRIGERIREGHPQIAQGNGYDHNFILDRASPGDVSLIFCATVRDPESGRTLDVHTTEPGVQIYCGNFLDGSLVGTSGHHYRQTQGIALETQHFPDSPNHPEFPTTTLRPGETFRSTTIYHFHV